MPIFLDTGDVREIEAALSMGVIAGVTTNPTLLRAAGIKDGLGAIKSRAVEIANLVAPLPLSVEVLTNDRDGMLRQAREFAEWRDNIVVKVPIHGPAGELHNLEVIHLLETEHDVRVNVTAMMSAQQCLLAATAGATYVSIFGGRVNNMGFNCCHEIVRLRDLLDRFALKGQIIVGSTREVLNVIEWLAAGAHIVTVTPSLLKGMIVHPYSKETVQQFLADAKALGDAG